VEGDDNHDIGLNEADPDGVEADAAATAAAVAVDSSPAVATLAAAVAAVWSA
jgi:hypothetical protein